MPVPGPVALAAALVAFAVAWAAAAFVRRGAVRLGMVDLPNPRSSHRHPRPRGGGLALVAGVAAGLGCALAWTPPPAPAATTLLVAALALGAIGLADDRRPLPVWPRLLAQVVAAVVFAVAAGGLDALPLPPPADLSLPAPVGIGVAVLWLVSVTNFYNFMDGIDGLAGGQAALVFAAAAALGWSGDAALLALLAGAATLGFLVLNWPPASLFLGDGGSGFLGFLLAGLPLLAPAGQRGDALLVVGAGMAFFLLDPAWTLLGRARRGQPLGVAHRDHLYQRLAVPGRPHVRVTVPLLAAGALLTLLAVVAHDGALSFWWVLASAAACVLLEAVLAARTAPAPSASSPGAAEVTERPQVVAEP